MHHLPWNLCFRALTVPDRSFQRRALPPPLEKNETQGRSFSKNHSANSIGTPGGTPRESFHKLGQQRCRRSAALLDVLTQQCRSFTTTNGATRHCPATPHTALSVSQRHRHASLPEYPAHPPFLPRLLCRGEETQEAGRRVV